MTVTVQPSDAAAAFGWAESLRTPLGAPAGSFRKAMPFSKQEAAMKTFSSVTGRSASFSSFSAAARPFLGSASFSFSTGVVVGASPSCSPAILTISGAGATGVRPK